MKKKIWIAVYAGAVLCVLALLLPIILLYGSHCSERRDVKEELDNPYINSGLKEWQTVSIEEADISFQIPSYWRLYGESGEYTILDINGTILAKVVVFGREDDLYKDTNDWFQSILSYPIENVTRTNISYNLFTGKVSFFNINVNGKNGEQMTIYELDLDSIYDIRRYVCFAFYNNGVLPETELIDYTEAIAYSYYFNTGNE